MTEGATQSDAQERDRALAQIYERYYGQVQGFIVRKVRDVRLAEDLANDTFVRALKHADTFIFMDRDLGAWLVTIARNLVIDHFKNANTKRVVASIDDDEDIRQWIDTTSHSRPEEEALLNADRSELLDAIRDLKEDQRTVLVMRYFGELSVAETAARMNKNENVIKALTFRALANLRKTLGLRAQRAEASDIASRIA
jgi:RNA polymerase sigma-70 factor (ECF subfamily)